MLRRSIHIYNVGLSAGYGNLHAHHYKVGGGFSPNSRGLSATESISQQEIGVVHSETFVQVLLISVVFDLFCDLHFRS